MSTHPSTRVLAISTLSPVHIGCGDVYEPSGFVIHDGLLHAFDAADLADALSEKEHRQLARLAEQAEPIGAIQRFFRESAAGLAQLARHQVDIVPALAREYADKIGQPTHRDPNGEATYNNFQLARTAYRPLDNAPYLPGSSLKGSIRTAWLNQKSLDSDIDWQDRSGKNSAATIEQRLLGYRAGEFQNDPFRLLALADANPEDADNPPPGRVLYAISKRKRLPRPGDKDPNSELKIFLETIPEALPTAFVGEMRFGPGARISWRALCDACNAYYRPRLEQELRHPVLGHLLDKNWSALIADLLGNELGELLAARQGFLLRVGRHAGAESVTLDGLRRIKILAELTDAQLEHLADFLELQRVPQWSVVVRQGEPGEAMYLVLEGELRARIPIGDQEMILSTFGPGEFFGEMALFDQGPRSADVVANVDSVLLRLSNTAFNRLTREAPALATPFLQSTARTLSARIRADNKRIGRMKEQFSAGTGN